MKHKTWFKLVLQAIGVLLVGFGGPELLVYIIDFVVYNARYSSLITNEVYWQYAREVAVPLTQTAFGIYLMTGASWLLNKFIPSNRPYCPECGYDLTHNTGAKCPECGVVFPGRAEEGAETAT